MALRIYSTLTGQEEELRPHHPDGMLRLYVCGMTPKFHPHVGHGRLFVAMDMVRRYLEFRGFPVQHVQNFTDIDDKIIDRARGEGRDPFATAKAYSDSYFEAMDRLNVRRAHVYPTVTGFMDQIIEFVAGLVDNGHAYVVGGDVYFSVAAFPGYGKLSHRDLNSQLVAARKQLEPGKQDPRDFALWKSAKPGEPSWESPWGPGRPGWHIECSTMSHETLGDQLDIHGGGGDLIFPHHENEIAQSESLTGKVPFAYHWVHAGLVTINDEKMAHSSGNFITIDDVLQRHDAAALRWFLLRTHYRAPLAFPVDDTSGERRFPGVEDAEAALTRLRRAIGPEPLAPDGDLHEQTIERFTEEMDADFNVSAALAPVFDLAREVNRMRAEGAPAADVDRARRTILYLLDVLGVDLKRERVDQDRGVAPYVELLLEVRRDLRGAKQYALADSLRARLGALGVVVEDKPDGDSAWHFAEGR